jgi:ABC-type polysaccharide/polyol phosphate transport system ATPase subunit
MARIDLDQVSLTFRLRRQRTTLKEFFIHRLLGRLRPRQTVGIKAPEVVRALEDVNLHIGPGERVGILGHNGAGKSTLLKLLAGIYPPTAGRRVVDGRIASLFDIALGFEQEGTGLENILYRGYLQGESPNTILAKMQEIADFTELGDFLKMPVRHYSAGMVVRLAFSIATAVEPEVLLIDEVLSVGDLAFQEKARRRMREMMARAKLLVMVSHDLKALEQLCPRGIWMDHGKVRMDDSMDEVISAYKASVRVPSAAA